MYLSPDQTTKSYNPTAGISAIIGSVQLQNVLIISSAKGAPGQMHGMATNNSDSSLVLTVTTGDETTRKVTIPASTAVRLDGQANGNDPTTVAPLDVPQVTQAPGSQVQVIFSTPNSGLSQVEVPVLLNQGPYGSASPQHPTYDAPSTEESPT